MDETSDAECHTQLDYWRTMVETASFAEQDLVATAWPDTLSRYHIPRHYALQLIDGVARDLVQIRYQTFDELATYCYGVASTVGLMSMHIVGFKNTDAFPYAIKLGVRDPGPDRYNLGYLAAIDAGSDPAAAEILLKAYAPNYISWVLYPTFARNLKAETFLAWMEPYALECSHPDKKPQILNAWKAIGKAALPSMERVKAAMEAKTPAQNSLAAGYAEDIAGRLPR